MSEIRIIHDGCGSTADALRLLCDLARCAEAALMEAEAMDRGALTPEAPATEGEVWGRYDDACEALVHGMREAELNEILP